MWPFAFLSDGAHSLQGKGNFVPCPADPTNAPYAHTFMAIPPALANETTEDQTIAWGKGPPLGRCCRAALVTICLPNFSRLCFSSWADASQQCLEQTFCKVKHLKASRLRCIMHNLSYCLLLAPPWSAGSRILFSKPGNCRLCPTSLSRCHKLLLL